MTLRDHSGGMLVEAWREQRRYLLGSRRWQGLPVEDREDLLQQAVLELLAVRFQSHRHACASLAQRFHQRAFDLIRARAGRSPDAMWRNDGAELPEVPAPAADRVVLARDTLRRLLVVLSPEERQALGAGNREAVRKRQQRARARLREAA